MDYAGDSAVRRMNTGAEAFYKCPRGVTRKKRGSLTGSQGGSDE
jgi:hypothetical protein